jgi:hypothetical protein
MAKLVCCGDNIGFTIIPYHIDSPPEKALLTDPSDYVLGYITHNKDIDVYKFNYTESGVLTEVNDHWSLTIVKMFPSDMTTASWIVYNCSPEKTSREFSKILGGCGETLHINNWDIWSVEGKESKVAVITSWEIF